MTEQVMLDSNIVYWFAFQPERLSPAARTALSDPSNHLFVSPFAIVEFAWKASQGRLQFSLPVDEWVGAQVRALSASELPFSSAHAAHMQSMPWHHRDPFDRMLIAQALAEDASIISADRIFDRYRVRVIW